MPELFLLIVSSGGGAVFFLFRWLNGKTVVSGLRENAVRSDAELEAANRRAALAEGTASEQRVLLGDALTVARTVEHVDQTLTEVAEFLASRVAWRQGEPPALPGAQAELPASDPEDGRRW